ncbi:MAG: enoyl-CoA hydratase/isomerase family protein [Coriobacteriaceae bacterium]|jgi:enoyl-CoA hydratase/carnithine racemase|nr:enoyl-CoA hydratase/isomerase family protein [Coriobacteriaceae bacterium]
MNVYQDSYYLPEFTYDYEKIRIDKQGAVYICSFNDEQNLNAMSYKQMSEFNDFLIKVRLDKDCRIIILTGEGRSFCAGFNLNDLALEPPEDMGRIQRDFYIMQRMCSDQIINMRRCEQPIIGALKGYAVGGGLSISCACDMRILGESFKMNAGYLSIGYTGTDMGGSFFLPKIIGYARACEVLMNPSRFDAQKPYEGGLANKVVADDDVLEEALKFAQEICASTAPFSLRLTKECLQTSLDGTSFENVVKMENRNQVLASNTNDGIMGTLKMNPKNKEDVKENPEKYAFHNK